MVTELRLMAFTQRILEIWTLIYLREVKKFDGGKLLSGCFTVERGKERTRKHDRRKRTCASAGMQLKCLFKKTPRRKCMTPLCNRES